MRRNLTLALPLGTLVVPVFRGDGRERFRFPLLDPCAGVADWFRPGFTYTDLFRSDLVRRWMAIAITVSPITRETVNPPNAAEVILGIPRARLSTRALVALAWTRYT